MYLVPEYFMAEYFMELYKYSYQPYLHVVYAKLFINNKDNFTDTTRQSVAPLNTEQTFLGYC